jgi:lipid-A-disaccharide synthase-like uncharacterized protein
MLVDDRPGDDPATVGFRTDDQCKLIDSVLMLSDAQWLAVGLAGQALFSARFVLQWARSEKSGRSVVPVGFWYLSAGGGLVLTVYAIRLADPVFILGQGAGLLVYFRNLWLIHRPRLDLYRQ